MSPASSPIWKNHAADHGFHIHDERHFVEDFLHAPGVGGRPAPRGGVRRAARVPPGARIDPRTVLAFEDQVLAPEGDDPEEQHHLPLTFTWSLPPLPRCPDLLLLATKVAKDRRSGSARRGLRGRQLRFGDRPVEANPHRGCRVMVSVTQRSYLGEEMLCDTLRRCLDVSRFLLDSAPAWLDDRG